MARTICVSQSGQLIDRHHTCHTCCSVFALRHARKESWSELGLEVDVRSSVLALWIVKKLSMKQSLKSVACSHQDFLQDSRFP